MELPKIPFRKKKDKDFLLIEIGLEVVNIAKLSIGDETKIEEVGRKKFTTLDDMFNASLEAIDELAGKAEDLPKKAILGVSGGPIKTETTVAQYKRKEPKEPISDEEVSKILEEVSAKEEPGNLKLFFSTIASANIDDTKVSNPIGIKGEKAALSCFIAYKHPEELKVFDKLVDEIDMELEKIIPTSFAVAKMELKKGTEEALLFRLGKNRSEATLLTKGHIDRIVQFDLGVSNPELFLVGLETVLEKLPSSAKPEELWLYPDNGDVDLSEISERLEQFPWGNVGFEKAPRISVSDSSAEVAVEDVGLSALSMEAKE
jgi:hypothetical protein